MSEANTENKKSATERLEELEGYMGRVIQELQPLGSLIRDLMGLKEALKLLNNKVDAVVKAVNAGGPITDESLSKLMIENNVVELAGKVGQMVAQGLLAATDTVGKESFVVINEANPDGTVVNPRMQFLLSSLDHEEVRTKLEGAKVGDNVAIGDKGGSINVLEAYNVVTPQAPAAESVEAASPAVAESAPAAEVTTSDSAAPATEATA